MTHFDKVLKFSYMGLKIGNEKHQELLTETPFLLPMQLLTFNHMHKALSSSETFIYCYGLTLNGHCGPSIERDSRFFKD
jgi:hypothetical protein